MSEPRQCTVWGADRLVFALISSPAITLCRRGSLGIRHTVDDVDVGAAHPGHDQVAPFLVLGVAMARGTGVPARVVQLVADPRHLAAG